MRRARAPSSAALDPRTAAGVPAASCAAAAGTEGMQTDARGGGGEAAMEDSAMTA